MERGTEAFIKKDGFAEFLFGVAENPESIRELVPIGKNILKAISTALTEIRPELKAGATKL